MRKLGRISIWQLCIALQALPLFTSRADAWELGKSADSAWTAESSDGIRLGFSCSRGTGRVSMMLTDLSKGVDLSAPLASIEASGSLMLTIRLPDGRTSSKPIASFNEQGSVAAEVPTGSFDLEAFANGQSLLLEDVGTGKALFQSGMKGTGAARLAFRERCGI
ncbi:hypothetical protein FNJ84_20910 [Paracoccus sp. M683]|uniref:hypothetical protein n=1 Tax=Paracoccus sp. M683 TaxID=2594268 RepID=UPI00118042EE|nr:hypothetical protein [Paracoccus sp. M683]TRW92758.1 hypothetical protein FNJ84_20910 [Paracoccus sp. M683]